MLTFLTPGFHGYNIRFSPFFPNFLACAGSENYGLGGKGALSIFKYDLQKKKILLTKQYIYPNDGLYDVCWSENEMNRVWSVSADGKIEIWNIDCIENKPIKIIKAHSKVISSIHWNQVRNDVSAILTSSWDLTTKLWSASTASLISTFSSHKSIIYDCSWSPKLSSTFATCSGDGTLQITNIRQLNPILVIKASQSEILSCDWSKYDSNLISCASSDALIQVYDIRSFNNPLAVLVGHERGIKKIRFSPFRPNLIASVSYDFTTRLWDLSLPTIMPQPFLIFTHMNHREFVYGLDFSIQGLECAADYAWNAKGCLFFLPQINEEKVNEKN